MKVPILCAAIAAFYALHQDFWNWNRVEPLAFGFLPVGLWYHVLYSIGAATVMALLVRFAWPEHLEKPGEAPRTESGPGSNPPPSSFDRP